MDIIALVLIWISPVIGVLSAHKYGAKMKVAIPSYITTAVLNTLLVHWIGGANYLIAWAFFTAALTFFNYRLTKPKEAETA